MEKYSTKLARILTASGWTQEELARHLGVSFVTLNAWINEKSQPRPGFRQKIDLAVAEILGSDELDQKELTQLKKLALEKKFSVKNLINDRDLLEKITINLTYHSNATEGSTMTERDVEAVIYNNKVLRNHTAIEQREAINHQVALNFLLDELSTKGRHFTVTPELIRATHLRLMNSIISDAGEFRNHSVRIHGAYVPLANFMKISKLIKVWCDDFNQKPADKIAVLARLHAEFERIHPFSDGNGRTGRLLLFAQALHLNLAPPVIKKERRLAYYKYLELSQTREVPEPLEKFIAEAIIETSGIVEGSD